MDFATYKDEQLARREQAPFAAYLISGLPKSRELQLQEEDRLFQTKMNEKKVWVMEDSAAFTLMYPEDY